MQGLAAELIESVLALPEAFGAVAANDPVAALLLLVGLVLLGVTGAAGAYLGLGAAIEGLTPE